MIDINEALVTAIPAAIQAGEEILEVYSTDFSVEYKEDESPLTAADKRAQNIIEQILRERFPEVPFLGEESRNIPYEERRHWKEFWLVDPLDGTKEFVKRNGEFTVNIALIRGNRPVLGVIVAPVLKRLYFGADGFGSFRVDYETHWQAPESLDEIMSAGKKLPLPRNNRPFTVVASRSHMNDETREYIEKIRGEHDDIKLISAGSSLKFCLVAEGRADVYPRFAPTMEWDTAAGDAVCRAANLIVKQVSNGQDMVYNREELLNPWFIVDIEYSCYGDVDE
jgi:3'(2'), 5'-bisphosphate nucleotidase